ncbi:MAG: hypothetical protein D3M94_10585 [Rhodocyclales bacterium GT-UBC]|nr:MAG: hypothetical protein D3M94_10585 [Rhodocyclales bacterium GT-UBC]
MISLTRLKAPLYIPLPEVEINVPILIEKYSRRMETSVYEVRRRVAWALAQVEDREALPLLHRWEEHLRHQISSSVPKSWICIATLLNLLQWLSSLKASLSGENGEAKGQATHSPLRMLRPQARAPPRKNMKLILIVLY